MEMEDTQFRIWMDELNKPSGAESELSRLFQSPTWKKELEEVEENTEASEDSGEGARLQKVIDRRLEKERAVDRAYVGEKILISRKDYPYEEAISQEKRAVRGLYHKCLDESDGCLTIGNDRYWLLSYEVPCQSDEKGRRADLLGLSSTGGIVVFEAKLGKNSCGPVASFFEGLDYQSCLTCDSNLSRMQEEFPGLKSALGNVPPGFESVKPDVSKIGEVILFADPVYYGLYKRSDRGSGWEDLASARQVNTSVRLRSAVSDVDLDGYFKRDVQWYENS